MFVQYMHINRLSGVEWTLCDKGQNVRWGCIPSSSPFASNVHLLVHKLPYDRYMKLISSHFDQSKTLTLICNDFLWERILLWTVFSDSCLNCCVTEWTFKFYCWQSLICLFHTVFTCWSAAPLKVICFS